MNIASFCRLIVDNVKCLGQFLVGVELSSCTIIMMKICRKVTMTCFIMYYHHDEYLSQGDDDVFDDLLM